MWRLIFSIFLILHGLVHVGAATAPVPGQEEDGAFKFFTGDDRSWLLRNLGVDNAVSWWLAVGLIAFATAGFVVAGIGVLTSAEWWRGATIGSAAVSLLLIVLYWNRYLPIGVAINIGLLIILLWTQWPSEETLGT